jgi:y4mF family transcriptional regulator
MLLHIKYYIYLKSMQMHITMKTLANFVKEKRNDVNLTQEAFAERAGVALTVVRKIEQGKENLNLSKVNQVLKMFGHTLAPVKCKGIIKNRQSY